MAAVKDSSPSPIPATPVYTRECALTGRLPRLPPFAPLGQLATSLHQKGAVEGDAEVVLHHLGLQSQLPQGRNMLLPPVGAGRDLLLPRRLWLPGGHGDPG